jgi:RHS repeat-associated protein
LLLGENLLTGELQNMSRPFFHGLAVTLLLLSFARGQNTIPFFDPFDNLNNWTVGTPNPNLTIESTGGNKFLQITGGGSILGTEFHLRRYFNSVRPNVISFQISGDNFNQITGINRIDISFTQILAPGSGVFFPIILNRNGTLRSISDEPGPVIPPLAAGVWYEIRIENPLGGQQKFTMTQVGQSVPLYVNKLPGHTLTGIDFIEISYRTRDAADALIGRIDNFSLHNEYSLNTSAQNGVINISSSPNSFGKYLEGDTVTLTPVPNPGYKFIGWTGGIISGDSIVHVQMNMDKDIQAVFVKNQPHMLTVENLNDQGGVVSIEIPDGGSQLISTLIPSGKAFLSWQRVSGAGQVTLSSYSSPTATATLSNGDYTIKAVFDEPKVRVFVKDDAAGDAHQIKPVIKILNDSKTFPLTDFEVRFFFKTECLKPPVLAGVANGSWDDSLYNIFSGYYLVKFKYSGTIAPGDSVNTPTGLSLSYLPFDDTCQTCPKYWNKENDFSLNGAKKKFKELTAKDENDNIVVLKKWGDSEDSALFGRRPMPEPDFIPSEDLGREIQISEPLDPPDAHNPQIPNVTTSWSFPSGNFVSNGSFENGKSGWSLMADSSCPFGPTFTIENHGPSPLEASLDGFHHAKFSTSCGGGLEGITFEIPESHPAFKTILNGYQPITVSAWVRGNGEPNSFVQLVQFQEGTAPFGSSIIEATGEWKLLQFTVDSHSPIGAPGRRSYKFGILQGGFQSTFFIDGVTLVQGAAYIPPVLSYTWTNTRNTAMQNRTLIPAEPSSFGYDPGKGKVVVSNFEFDSLGRVSKSFLPFTDSCNSASCNPYYDSTSFRRQLDSANRKYIAGNSEGLPNAEGFAYLKTVYEQDQVTSVLKTGRPGRNFQIDSAELTTDHREHAVHSHYSGVSGLSPDSLGNDLSKPANKKNPDYSFVHALDPDSNEAMEWRNGFGELEQRAVVLVENGTKKFITTQNVYDDRGNLVKVIPPGSCKRKDGTKTNLPNCVDPTEYKYDPEQRLVEEASPDAGTTRFFYDLMGNKRISQTEVQRANHRLSVSVFDDLGRVRFVGEYDDKLNALNSQSLLKQKAEDLSWPKAGVDKLDTLSKYFYDEMPPPVPEELAYFNSPNVRLYPDFEAGDFQNTRGRLCAVITYQPLAESFNLATLEKIEEVSTVAYRYDKYGHVIKTFKYNGFITKPDFKLQAIENNFDITGRLIQTRNFENAYAGNSSQNVFYSYNSQGQLSNIQNEGGQSLAEYIYYPSNGKVKTVVLDNFGTNPIRVDYAYNIQGGVSEISAARQVGSSTVALYNEKLFYDLLPVGSTSKGKYGGDIAQVDYKLGSQASSMRTMEYSYDNLGRLLDAVFFLNNGSTKTRTDKYSESMKYEDDGRIRSLRRSDNVTHGSGGEYHYQSLSIGAPGDSVHTNRLAYVSPGMSPSSLSMRDMSGSALNPNFTYDAAGRLIGDRSKSLQIRYDFRDRPVEFTHYKGAKRLKEVMRYDESGNRISNLSLEGAVSDSQGIIVDADPAHERDAATLAEGLIEMQSIVGPLTTNPNEVKVCVVPGSDGFVNLNGINEITALTCIAGPVGMEISGAEFDSPEYASAMARRNSGFKLTEARHYTGFGNEIRESDTGSTELKTVVFTDMPNGLGRYNPGTNGRLYYLKNHLGSTMVTALAGGTFYQDVYDYYPYGLQDRVAVSSVDKVTNTFTGKELDDPTGLYYFGARYLDPELGMWISPDPARQFASPYAYSPNPVNSFDPDGKVSIKGNVGLRASLIITGGVDAEVTFNVNRFFERFAHEYYGPGMEIVRGASEIIYKGLDLFDKYVGQGSGNNSSLSIGSFDVNLAYGFGALAGAKAQYAYGLEIGDGGDYSEGLIGDFTPGIGMLEKIGINREAHTDKVVGFSWMQGGTAGLHVGAGYERTSNAYHAEIDDN